MSASAKGGGATTKAVVQDPPDTSDKNKDQQKPAAPLEEDDEFEDFPVEDWTEEEAQIPEANTHLWEESWDDDDTSEEFLAQLQNELKKSDTNRAQ